jgi:hypothetical protein
MGRMAEIAAAGLEYEEWLYRNPEHDFKVALDQLKAVMPHVSRGMAKEYEQEIMFVLDELNMRLSE